MDSREAVRNQLFPEIAVFRLDKRIKTLTAAAAHRICHASGHGERLGQFLPGEFFRRLAHFDGLWDGDAKIFGLFGEARRSHFVCLGRINHVETEDIFSFACAHMKAVAVIRRVGDESAIVQHNPVFRSVTCANVDSRGPKNGDTNQCGSGESQRGERAKDQGGTSNWLINLNVS